jgi:hypothetical protein
LGVGLGAAVGTLTGTLVGGPVGLITGGIGAGIGKLHGPFVNISDWGLDKLRGITGDLPGWKATEEQKKTLEKMCGQVAETEAPSPEELENIAGNAAGGTNEEAAQMVSSVNDTKDSWKKSAGSYVPEWAGGPKAEEKPADDEKQQKPSGSSGKATPVGKTTASKDSTPSKSAPKDAKQSQSSGPRKLGKPITSTNGSTPQKSSSTPKQPSSGDQASKRDSASPTNQIKKKPRKLETKSAGSSPANAKSAGSQSQGTSTPAPKRTPKKLETRS